MNSENSRSSEIKKSQKNKQIGLMQPVWGEDNIKINASWKRGSWPKHTFIRTDFVAKEVSMPVISTSIWGMRSGAIGVMKLSWYKS